MAVLPETNRPCPEIHLVAFISLVRIYKHLKKGQNPHTITVQFGKGFDGRGTQLPRGFLIASRSFSRSVQNVAHLSGSEQRAEATEHPSMAYTSASPPLAGSLGIVAAVGSAAVVIWLLVPRF